jgi:hypothetical protein
VAFIITVPAAMLNSHLQCSKLLAVPIETGPQARLWPSFADVGCGSAWGPAPIGVPNPLIFLLLEGAKLGAYSQSEQS